MPAKCLALIALAATLAAPTRLPADWQVHHPHDQRESSPPAVADSQPVKPGDPWPGDAKFRWLRGTL